MWRDECSSLTFECAVLLKDLTRVWQQRLEETAAGCYNKPHNVVDVTSEIAQLQQTDKYHQQQLNERNF